MTTFKFYLLFYICLLYISSVLCGVPVLIWESSAVTKKDDVVPALWQLDVDEFSNHLTKKIHVHKPLIVVFLEETLSVEDFSWQDVKHHGSFPQIKNITSMSAKLEFIPSVDDPIASLKELMNNHNYEWKKYDGVKLPSQSGVILEVKMKDPLNNEDRPDLLRRHDGNIADIYSQLLAKHSRILALYTGKQSSWVEFESNRVRRDAEEGNQQESNSVDYVNANKDILLHSNNLPVILDNGSNITLQGKPKTVQDDTRKGYKRLIVSYTTDEPKKIVLRLKFPLEGNRWSLSEVEYQNDDKTYVLTPSQDISAKLQTSYVSSAPVIFKNDTAGVSLKFADLKVQAYATSQEFSPEAYDGPEFFTAPIWSGIIVTFVLMIILTFGIVMLMDIRTMDRFDDPKGKTITVSATD